MLQVRPPLTGPPSTPVPPPPPSSGGGEIERRLQLHSGRGGVYTCDVSALSVFS
jgi:hypothetical protein